MNKNLKPRIIELRDRGYTYDQIAGELNCSKGTISYHLGEGVRDRQNKRVRKHRQTLNPLVRKWESFKGRPESETKDRKPGQDASIRRILNFKRVSFSRPHKSHEVKEYLFTMDELMEMIGDDPRCYLTGRPIDLTKSRSYQLDHKIPRSRGGDNSLENCGLCCREANMAKSDMTVDEFKKLCLDVVNNG